MVGSPHLLCRRLSPFGFIQTYLMRTSTKRGVRKVYWNRKTESLDSNDANKDVSRRSSSSSQDHDYDTQSQYTDHHEQYPLLFKSMVTPPGQKDRLQPKIFTPELEGMEGLIQKIQHQKEELASLRAFVQDHGEILNHLQKHEERFRSMEVLVKQLYLDVDLVDCVVVDLKNSSRTSNIVESSLDDMTQEKSWFRRLFKSGKDSASSNVQWNYQGGINGSDLSGTTR